MNAYEGSKDGTDFQSIGKYRIIGTLGRGSMGIVYKAQDPEIGRMVAIKTLRKIASNQFVNHSLALQRFRTEARSAGNLRHPNLITIFDVSIEGDTPYIVMDFVDGEALDAVLEKNGHLEPEVAIYYLKQVAAGMDSAHRQGVIHRDLKPSNILVGRDDTVYVVDFGVASISESIGPGQSSAKKEPVMGTPAYMSPEQILNKELDHRSDLFGLAVVAFELFTGKRPFPGKNFSEVLGAILNNKPLPLTSLAELPIALEREFDRALAKNRDERFKTADEMVSAFAKALGVERVERPARKTSADDSNEVSATGSDWHSLAEMGKGSSRPQAGQGPETSSQPGSVQSAKAPGGSSVNTGAGTQEDILTLLKKKQQQAQKDQQAAERQGHRDKKKQFVQREATSSSSSVVLSGSHRLVFKFLQTLPMVGLAVVVLGVGLFGISFLWERTQTPTPPAPSPAQWDWTTDSTELENEVLDLPKDQFEAPPPGKPVAKLTDRQLLGLIVSEESSEEAILNGMEEARLRRLPALVQAARFPLQNASHVVRMRTIKLLASLRDPKAVPLLLERLDDLDPLVRSNAAEGLAELGSVRSLGYLRRHLEREEIPYVREELAAAIEKIQGFPLKRKEGE